MKLNSRKPFTGKTLIIFIFTFSFCVLQAQQTPLSSVSYWVFNPYIYNPAMVGSKDFLSIGINAAFQGESNSQLFSGNTRITRTNSGYFSSPDITEFKNTGLGASVFKDIIGSSKDYGLSLSGSYQIPMSTSQLSFLSFGLSLKAGNYSRTSETDVIKKTFSPNLDLGIYFYGTNFFTGISSINLFGGPWGKDSVSILNAPVSREYFFTSGFKILLSKSMNIVVEPSILISSTDSTFNRIKDNIRPIVKLYLDDFCLGTSFHNHGKFSFFIQYRYPRFYVGAFYELANKTAYYKNKPLVEFTLGLNLQSDKSRFANHSHW
jgi:type IX secretion system PorP/SprF family membrane protein